MEQPPSKPGVRAHISYRRAPHDGGMVPELIIHVRRRLQWQVREVLDHWEHPDGVRARGAAVRQAWRMRVFGPLPYQPQEDGEFVMVAKMYADLGGWWITPRAR